jgi:hypothetical protein
MNFKEAEQARGSLNAKKQNGELTAEAYCAGINNIRVTDAKNCWWQPDPKGPGWLFWNGKEWVAGVPPGEAAAPLGATGSPLPAKPVEYTFRPVSDDEPGYKLMSIRQFILIAKIQPWKKRPRKWWDLFSVLTGVTLAFAWFVYTCLNPWSEGWDLLTPVLMIAIPLFLVCFRKDLDNILMPLQPHREKLPYLLLFGLGICVPFLTAYIMLNWAGIREYSLMHLNVIVGTSLAYAITREPVLAAGYKGTPRSLKLPLVLFLLLTLVIQIVRADDCGRNPLNGADCLRTGGAGEGMAGGASAGQSAANAAGDAVTTDPGFSDWLNTLDRNTWYTTRAGVDVMVDDDGMVHYRYHGSGTSGSDAGTTGDSGTSERNPPGTSQSTTVDPETGATKTITTMPNGTTLTTETSADGKTTTTTTTDANGTTVQTEQTVTNPDGTKTKTTTYNDGKQSTSTYNPRDRTTTETDTSGEVTKVYPDGTRTEVTTNPDNSTTETWPDGHTRTTYPDGHTDTTPPRGPSGDDSGKTGGPGESTDNGETGGFGGEDTSDNGETGGFGGIEK